MTRNIVIIPEPHWWDKAFETMPKYTSEMKIYQDEIKGYLEKLENPTVIFMGDIFHREFEGFGAGISSINYIHGLNRITHDNCFSVVGNHEFTYRKNNPFWYISDRDSEFLSKFYAIPNGTDYEPAIKIRDFLRIGSVEFVFGHYNREFDNNPYKTDAKQVILLTHNNILTSEIDQILKKKYNRDVKSSIIDYRNIRGYEVLPKTDKLKYVFVGHMHTAFSRFIVEESIGGIEYNFILQYLGSLGRTINTEVNNEDLRRVLPTFTVFDDETVNYSEKEITLQPREVIVCESKVTDNKEAYKAHKQLQEYKRFEGVCENPIEAVKEGLPAILQQFFDDAVAGRRINSFDEIVEKINQRR